MYSELSYKTPERGYLKKAGILAEKIKKSSAILIGAGTGLSTAAGIIPDGDVFRNHFGDFISKYGFRDLYTGFNHSYDSFQELWAYRSRFVYYERYLAEDNGTFAALLDMVRKKDYFIITTDTFHMFQKAGFNKKRLFYVNGDYGLFKCCLPCRQKTFDNRETIEKMAELQQDMKIPMDLLPTCPYCGRPATINVATEPRFVQDKGWLEAVQRFNTFLKEHQKGRVLYLELGAGLDALNIIKYNFQSLTSDNPKSFYVRINLKEAFCLEQIKSRSLFIYGDIEKVLKKASRILKENKVPVGKGPPGIVK